MPACTEDNDDCYLAASGDECEENLIRGISDGERRCPTSRFQSNLHSKIWNLLHREQICYTGSRFLHGEQIFTRGANYDKMLTLPISEPIEFTVSSWSEHGTEKICLSFLLSVSWLCFCIGDFETNLLFQC